MAVKIRLRRMGAKKAPYYALWWRIPDIPGMAVSFEEIGFYNPME